mmetsp:Transcript_53181/g.94974  ORF Transcript_53181/g.94974 Transcript_53181/m.94974 type:complete len:304 (-) Transcript_53181:1972-2883(-)
MILFLAWSCGHTHADLEGRHQHVRQVNELGLVGSNGVLGDQQVGATSHLLHSVEAHLRHVGTDLLSHHEEVVDNMLRCTIKLFTEDRILGSNTNWAGVQVALAHHGATHSNQGGSRETELISAKHAGNHDITASAKLSVGLQDNAATQVVQDQSLMGFSQTQLPRQTSVLYTSPATGTCSTIVARNGDVVRMALGDSRGNDTDTNLRHQLDRNTGLRVRTLQIVDQLGQILDGVDIVVGWGGDQTHTRSRIAARTDARGNLVTWQFSTFTRLGTLCHLDLDLDSSAKICNRDTKATGGNLLDG